MLARTYGPKYNKYPTYVQPKLNGIRALYQNGIFQSRDEKLWKSGVLQHLVDELHSLPLDASPILDGELYVHNWKLQRINGAVAVNRLEPIPDTLRVEYHIFDRVAENTPFSERWIAFKHILETKLCLHIKIVPTDYINNTVGLDSLFNYWTALGYEGVMLRPDGPYEYGETPHGTQKRSEFLWKKKMWEDGEFECVGVTRGEGKADIGIGALECAVPKPFKTEGDKTFHMFFKVGTGFSDEDRISYMQNPPIGKLVRIRYLCLTEDGIPFNPSFLCVME